MSAWGYLGIIWGSLLIGVILGWGAHGRLFRNYSGTLVVSTDELGHKTVYSLVLDEYPEKLQFEKVVIFRVENPEQSSDRG